MVTDVRRRKLFDSLVRELGEDSAETMMELLPLAGWSDLARRGDLAELRGEMQAMDGRLTAEIGGLRGEMGELRTGLRGEMAELRVELRGEMAELRVELRGEMVELRGELRGEMAELRGEVAALGSRIDAQFAKLVAANLFTSAALAALIGAAVRLFGG